MPIGRLGKPPCQVLSVSAEPEPPITLRTKENTVPVVVHVGAGVVVSRISTMTSSAGDPEEKHRNGDRFDDEPGS